MLNYNLKLFSYNDLFNHFVHLDLNKKLPSKILLVGQEGIGKTTFAMHFINYLFSKKETTHYNITKNLINSSSKSFGLVNNLSHPNFFYISKVVGKQNIDIDQVRNMINFLNKSSFDNKKKIIFINGAEDLNLNSSNSLLKSLEESSDQNFFILTQNVNRRISDTIKSRCLTYQLYFDYTHNKNIIDDYFKKNLYDELNDDFKSIKVSPSFVINHIIFIEENELELKSFDVKKVIHYIIDNKSYIKNSFIINNFQIYIEIYFMKMYSKTKDYKYYDSFLKSISENNLNMKFNLDLDSYFIQFGNKYFNI